jgi:hypothetical protein
VFWVVGVRAGAGWTKLGIAIAWWEGQGYQGHEQGA